MEKRPNYKRNTRILLLTAAAALLTCAIALFFKQRALMGQGTVLPAQGNPQQSVIGYYIPKPSVSQENGTVSPSPPASGSSASSAGQVQSAADQERYLITVSDGKIGVFRQGESSPFLTADIDVYLLPDEDIAILKKGIRVTGFSQVKSVLEDYE